MTELHIATPSPTPPSPVPNSFSSGELSDAQKHVAFFIGDELFCVHAEEVAEVAQLPFITPLPNAPALLIGIAANRDNIVAIVDIAAANGKPSVDLTEKTRLIVLRQRDEMAQFAFPVDELHEIRTYSAELLSRSEQRPNSPFGQITDDGGSVTIISPSMIPRLLIAE
jgi:chemotaxis signal transduction protein